MFYFAKICWYVLWRMVCENIPLETLESTVIQGYTENSVNISKVWILSKDIPFLLSNSNFINKLKRGLWFSSPDWKVQL